MDVPEGFSYGPTIVQVTPNASTAEGGGTGIIYGYGLGPVAGAIIPADLTITVGGQPATILGFNSGAYGLASPPFQLEAVAFSIPPGTAGTSVAVTVSNSSGTTTANAAFSYLPPIQIFNTGPTELAQGIYDHLRDVYYFTSATQVLVFSKTQGRLLAPIDIPASQRLWGSLFLQMAASWPLQMLQQMQFIFSIPTAGHGEHFSSSGFFPSCPGSYHQSCRSFRQQCWDGLLHPNQSGRDRISWLFQAGHHNEEDHRLQYYAPGFRRRTLCCARPLALTARACTLTMPARYSQSIRQRTRSRLRRLAHLAATSIDGSRAFQQQHAICRRSF